MSALKRKIKLARTMVRLGPSTLMNFGLHRLKARSGAYQKALPTAAWASTPAAWARSGRSPFHSPAAGLVRSGIGDASAAQLAGDRIVAGEMLYFSRHWLPFAGWRKNPHTGFETNANHWSRIPDFNAEQGDVKWIWEASRFDWVYRLGRAWAATGDDKYVAKFWALFESWRTENAPNVGANWKCGQECSLRLFALAWAAAAFAASPTSTADRLAQLYEVIGALAERVQPAIGYAVAQRNNHALSEAAGLTLAAFCLPDHPKASTWASIGRQVMTRQVAVQFEVDGSYAQHSNNYTRIALRDLFVFATVLEATGEKIDTVVRERALAATRLLFQMHDPATGRVPNYGANDGANILSLSEADYLDYRPLLQTLAVRFSGQRLLDSGPWDEELLWHFGRADFPKEEQPLKPFQAGDGGYFGLRGPNSFGLLRCHTYKMPPSHADSLALDLWVNGVNVLPDKGTYQYYDPRDLGTYFGSTAAHNTVEVNGQSQMLKGTRFLYIDWVKAQLNDFAADGTRFDGQHTAYAERFGVTHRRAVHRRGDEFLIVDDVTLSGSGERDLVLRWHLKGQDWSFAARTAHSATLGLRVSVFASGQDGIALLQGPAHSPETEESLYYAELAPLTVMKAAARTAKSFRWITTVGPSVPAASDGELRWHDLVLPLAFGAPTRPAVSDREPVASRDLR